MMRLEVERILPEDNDVDTFSESSSISNGSGDGDGRIGDTSLRSIGKSGRALFNGRPKWSAGDRNDSGKHKFSSFSSANSPDHQTADVRSSIVFCQQSIETIVISRVKAWRAEKHLLLCGVWILFLVCC